MREKDIILTAKLAKAAFNSAEVIAEKADMAYESLEAANQAVIECQSDNETAIQYYEGKVQKLQKQMFWGFLIVSAVYTAALTIGFLIIA